MLGLRIPDSLERLQRSATELAEFIERQRKK